MSLSVEVPVFNLAPMLRCNLRIRIYIPWTMLPTLCVRLASKWYVCGWLMGSMSLCQLPNCGIYSVSVMFNNMPAMPGWNHLPKAFKIIIILISKCFLSSGFYNTDILLIWIWKFEIQLISVSKEISMNPLKAHFKTFFFSLLKISWYHTSCFCCDHVIMNCWHLCIMYGLYGTKWHVSICNNFQDWVLDYIDNAV